jgi:ATP-binding cassette subfamily B (MDR/TAP) protein 1
MADGLILEQGTHSELLDNENGPYSRLVAAQQLREMRDVELRKSDTDASDDKGGNMEQMARDEIPLGRQKSSPLLANEVISQKEQNQNDAQNDHGLFYVFVRMCKLNRTAWKKYGIGVVAACRAYFFRRVLTQTF